MHMDRAGHQQRLLTQMNQQPQNQRPDNAGWVTGARDEGGCAFATIRRPPGPQRPSRHHTHFSPHLLTTNNDNCPQLSSGENRGSRCGAMVSTTYDSWAQMSSQNQRVGGSIPSRRTKHAGHRPARWRSSYPGGPPHTFNTHFLATGLIRLGSSGRTTLGPLREPIQRGDHLWRFPHSVTRSLADQVQHAIADKPIDRVLGVAGC